tara:strand:- start:122 stop:469 length:348 start_codon:yes stop_codon:yes gene_type:complete
MNIELVENDFAFIDNKVKMLSNIDEMVQKISNCLNSFKGDWFLDLSLGVPYFQEIYIKGISKEELIAIFMNYLSQIDGVIAINTIDVEHDPSTRTSTLSFTAKTKDGVLNFTSDF